MAMNKKVIAVLAIFLIIASVSTISAAEHVVINQNQDSVLQSSDDAAGDDNPYHNGELTPNEKALQDDNNTDDNPYHNGELTPNEKALQDDANALANASGANASSANASGEHANTTTTAVTPATGNPILVLLAAIAILGAYPLSRKK